MLYAFGFIGLFTIGGLTGLFLAALAVDVHVTRHVFRGCAFPLHHGGRRGDGISGGIHYWWPKITGRLYPEGWAKFSAVVLFIGFNLTFFPQFILGYLGMPRRYFAYPPEFQVLNVLSTAGASILGVGYILPHHLPYSGHSGTASRPGPIRGAQQPWSGDDILSAYYHQLRGYSHSDDPGLRPTIGE